MKVADIMTTEVVTIRNSATVAEAVKQMRRHSIQAVIVDRNHEEDAYGIVTVADIVGKVIAFGQDTRRRRVYEIMNKPCIVLNPDLGIEYAARLLASAGIHSAPVVQKSLLGIVSMTDILQQGDFIERPQTLQLKERLQHLEEAAHQTCYQKGPGSQACLDAWAKVDALEAELAHQQAEAIEKTAFESYMDDYPEAFKDREYDAWCGG
ncbi:CBS domain-containing protein [Nodosilinea sp. LEGE 07088]|uniref:CBS domain-containing protein n=1 Tax=Nodosilinea sp. LEGE 07088 TaxID=2777968 RepID=UPI001882ED28|nr:CBS domain-containing protein [Nodosilinea sp. LEGE 07088]MBE9140290.1 CBS domain-containing protein [Nodosilinea sp. LEGE 07088]